MPHIQFNGRLGLYDVIVDNYTVMHCSQTHFYPPNVDAPKTENPANTIACKNLVILDQKIKKTQVFFLLEGGWINWTEMFNFFSNMHKLGRNLSYDFILLIY